MAGQGPIHIDSTPADAEVWLFLGANNANVRDFHNLHADLLEFTDLRGLDLSRVGRLVMVDTRDAGRIGDDLHLLSLKESRTRRQR